MKTSRFFAVLLVILFIGFAGGCYVPGRIQGNGNVINQERSIRGFNGIVLNGAAIVNVHQSDGYRVTVRTDSNLQNMIETKVNNNLLQIGINLTRAINTGFNPTELTIDIYMPELTEISVNGAGNITIADGKASSLRIALNGAATIDAQNYEVDSVSVNLSGAGDVKIWAVSGLDYQISGVGTVRYRGNPTLSGRTNGLGRVNRL